MEDLETPSSTIDEIVRPCFHIPPVTRSQISSSCYRVTVSLILSVWFKLSDSESERVQLCIKVRGTLVTFLPTDTAEVLQVSLSKIL